VKGKQTPKRRRPTLIALGLGLALVGWLMLRRTAPAEAPAPERVEEEAPPPPAPAVPAPAPAPPVTAAAPPSASPSRPALEYMSDGVPLMPPGPDDPHPNTFVHPHPITPKHKRIFRENALLFQLNEAVDGREAPRLRELLRQYREEYPEDPHDMQKGYALIADCVEHPNDGTRAAARAYYDEEIASTLRRFVHRHCLETDR
jgi:hypothetical protein